MKTGQWGGRLLTFLLAGALACYAQVTGRLSGRVLDPSAAVVPGATVLILNEGTGTESTTETNSEGVFLAPQLDSGLYTVRVSAANFKTAEVRNIKVDVGKEYSLPPISLEVGAVQETMTVTAGVNRVQTTTAEVNRTLYTEQIKRLPLAFRDPLELLAPQAGVARNGRTVTIINGTRASFSNLTLDGINIQDNFIRDNALDYNPNQLFLGQVSEITITTQNADPSVGNGSSQVSLLTPSGTNGFHGELFWHNRNNALAANSFFNNASGIERPFFLVNQFGGNFGGPIRRDKLFFYAYFEGLRQRQKNESSTVVLRPDARDGIFTYRDLSGNLRQRDVLEAAGVPLDPFVRSLLERVPKTVNFPALGDGLNTGGYLLNQRDNRTQDNVGVRLDYKRSASQNFGGTVSWNRDLVDRPDLDSSFHQVPTVINDNTTQFLSVNWRWTPTARLTNEVRGGFNIAPGVFQTSEDFSGGRQFSGFLFTNPANNFRRQGRDTSTYALMDNAAWQRGAHAVRFGWQSQFIRIRPYDEAGILPAYGIGLSPANPRGLSANHFPGGIRSADLALANALMASLAGFVSSASQTFNATGRTSGYVPGAEFVRHHSLNSLAFYGTDQWRLRGNLTLNLGLRWEYMGRYDERDGLLLMPVVANNNVVQTLLSNATVDFVGAKAGRPIYPRDLNNFAPQVGLAWDPWGNGKTAFRLGYSLNYVNDELISAPNNAVLANSGLSTDALITNLTRTISGGLPPIPTPVFQLPRTFLDQLEDNPTAAGFAVHPNLVNPYVQQWNASLQRELPGRISLEVRYVGNKGTKLYRGRDYNQVVIGPNGFLADFLRARSNGFLAQERLGAFIPLFNPTVPGSQPLTVFPNLLGGGLLTNATIQGLIQRGEVGELAAVYFVNDLAGSVPLVPNPNIFVADLLQNTTNSVYHALQVEVNRYVLRHVFFGANFTWSKVLTDSPGSNETRFDPYLDIAQPRLERARADYDIPVSFKTNFIWQLPFGQDQRWAPAGRVWNKLASGWSMSSIVTWQSGAPFSIVSGRGTLNRAGRSGENTAVTLQSPGSVKSLFGVRKRGDSVYFVDPGVLAPDGRGVAQDGSPPFAGQVFFNPAPGEVGTLARRMFNGPTLFDWDFAVLKETRIRETKTLEVRVEIFSILNHPIFFTGDRNINSINFGKMFSTLTAPRFVQTSLRFTF